MRIPQHILISKDSYLEIQVIIDINGSIFIDKANIYKNTDKADPYNVQAIITEDLSSIGSCLISSFRNEEMQRELNDLNVQKAKSMRNEIEKEFYSIKQGLQSFAEFTLKSEVEHIEQLTAHYHDTVEELEDKINDLDTVQQLKTNFFSPMQAIESNILYRANLVNRISSIKLAKGKEVIYTQLDDILRRLYQEDSIHSLIEINNELDLLNPSRKSSIA